MQAAGLSCLPWKLLSLWVPQAGLQRFPSSTGLCPKNKYLHIHCNTMFFSWSLIQISLMDIQSGTKVLHIFLQCFLDEVGHFCWLPITTIQFFNSALGWTSNITRWDLEGVTWRRLSRPYISVHFGFSGSPSCEYPSIPQSVDGSTGRHIESYWFNFL